MSFYYPLTVLFCNYSPGFFFFRTQRISSRIRSSCEHRRRKFKSWWPSVPVYQLLLRRPPSSRLQEFPIQMWPPSPGQPPAPQRNLEPPLGGRTPQSPRTLIGALAPSPHQTSLDLLHPLNLLADCLVACDLDSVSKADAGSDSGSSSGRELNEFHPPPSDFQDVSHDPSMRIAYRNLVPMTRLFSTWLLISKGDQRHLANFIPGQDTLWTCTLTMRISK